MMPLATVGISVVTGIVVVVGEKLLEKHQIDDAINVVPVHLFCGIWEALALVLFSDMQNWDTGLNFVQQLSI
jgi:Amt family ammonium transporter